MAIPNTGTVTHTMLRSEFVMNEANSPQSKYYRGGTYVPANMPGTGGSPTPGTCNGSGPGGSVSVKIDDAAVATPGKLVGGAFYGNNDPTNNTYPQLGCPGHGGNPRGSLNPSAVIHKQFVCSDDGSFAGSGQGPQGVPNRATYQALDCYSALGNNNPPSYSIISSSQTYGYYGFCSYVAIQVGGFNAVDGDPIAELDGTCYYNTEQTLNPPSPGGSNPPTPINTGVPTAGQIKLSNMYGSFDYP